MINRCAKLFILIISLAIFITYLLFLKFAPQNVTGFFLAVLAIILIGAIIVFKIIKCEILPELKSLSLSYNILKSRESIILNSIREGVCWLDKKGNIIFANQSAKYILGYDDKEILGKNFHSLVHKHSKEAYSKCAIELTIKNRTCSIFRDEVFYKKNGTPIHVTVFSSPIINNKEIEGVVVTFIDLTYELKQQEEIKKYHTIIEQASMIVVITDIDGNIQYVNPTFEKVTGYKREEVIGQNPRILKSGKHPKSFYENLWQTILSGKMWEGEFINKKKDGTLYYEEANIFPLKDNNGNIINFVGIKKDITKTKELEEQLIQAQKLEAIGRLTGGIAHDFNNILTILSGYTEILENTIDKNDIRFNYIQKLKEAVDRASNLVNKLLAFSRKQNINPRPIDLVAEVRNLEKMLKRLIPEDITLKFEYKDESIIIYADPTQIEQILINLIVNARDAIYQKKDDKIKTIEVIIERTNKFAKIIVKDSGIGIPQNIQKKIFEPFFTTKKAGIGTGLGLSTVYGIVLQNKGRIKVESEYGQGAEFIIYLPVYESTENLNTLEENIKELPKGDGKILIVEDEKDIRKILKENLTKLGYHVFEAEDGLKALHILEENNYNFDLIISDVVMPEMDGHEFYKEVQNKNQKIKFLFVSGYSDDSLDEMGLKLDNVDFLRKPFSILEIANKIKELLANKKA